ncbi:glycosyltransferase [Solidesulfovibrio sp.]|uniref:glycosyltransferase n=1 Tax=Solidesulfovibrio sp. TaxID=2910990 RepID=UPI002639A5E0|nr:glycosyltransferase [Solidesulfovibrio sp.]
MTRPAVSVLLAVHNDAAHIRESLSSLLAQTLANIEVVAVDDGCTDTTPAILDFIAREDSRLRVLHRIKSGLGASLNAAAAVADGRLLARMDADDVSLPERLAHQATFLDAHQDVAVCGTFLRTFGAPPRRIVRLPTEDAAIRAELLFSCPVMHPTVMLRREVLETLGGYDPAVRYGEDYDLWVRAMGRFAFANLPRPLLRYRRHAGQMGARHSQAKQAAARMRSMGKALAHLGLTPTDEDISLHHAVSLGPCLGLAIPDDCDFLAQAEDWLTRIVAANDAAGFLPRAALASVIGRYWYFACFGAMIHDRRAFDRYRRSPLSRLGRPDPLSRAAMVLGGPGRMTRPARIAALALDAFGQSRFSRLESDGGGDART